ncbi:MAG: OPT/YSL family transporter [Elusimicrobiales bacterium]
MTTHKDELRPYIPPEKTAAEFTLQAVLLGLVLSVVFNAANAYLGLKIGMTVSASIPSAIISMATLRMILPRLLGRTGTILENNIVHAFASTGESLAAGVIFTVVAIIFLGGEISNKNVFLLGMAGGLLGLLMMIPLRQSLVVKEHKKLPFPEGSACAKVLIAGDAGGASAMPVFAGMLTGGLFKFAMSAFCLFKDVIMWTFPKLHQAGFGYEVSPLFAGIGYLVGLRISAVMFAGGIIGYWVIIPLIHAFGGHNIVAPGTVPIDTMVTDDLRLNYLRYIGAGGVAFGGLIGVLRSMPDIISSFTHGVCALRGGKQAADAQTEQPVARDPEHNSIAIGGAILGFLAGGFVFGVGAESWVGGIAKFLLYGVIGAGIGWAVFHFAALKSAQSCAAKRTEHDIPMPLVGAGIAATFVFLWLYPPFHLGFWEAVIIVVVSMFFVAVSARMVGLIGTTNQPVSGMTITALLAMTLLFIAIGHPSQTVKIAAITGGAAVCIAISLSGDLSQDLKCAALIGATPWKVQLAQIMSTAASAVLSGFILIILYKACGFGAVDALHPRALEAPQAQLMAKLVEGATGGGLPWTLLALGAGIGLVCELCDVSALAFAIGMYLPITNWPMILVGGAVAWFVSKKHSSDAPIGEDDPGSLYCSGLIAGDALMGIAIAGITVLGLDRAVRLRTASASLFEDALSTALYALIVIAIYRFAISRKPKHAQIH